MDQWEPWNYVDFKCLYRLRLPQDSDSVWAPSPPGRAALAALLNASSPGAPDVVALSFGWLVMRRCAVRDAEKLMLGRRVERAGVVSRHACHVPGLCVHWHGGGLLRMWRVLKRCPLCSYPLAFLQCSTCKQPGGRSCLCRCCYSASVWAEPCRAAAGEGLLEGS